MYSTTKTTNNLRKNFIDAGVSGEHIRTWEQKSHWSSSPYPISGKTILSKTIVENCPDNILYIESDSIRQYVAEYNDHKSPKFTLTESLSTFNFDNNNIKYIQARVHHPETNGKLERLNYTVKSLRPYFITWKEVVYHYNYERIHDSL